MTPYYADAAVTLYCCDCREVDLPWSQAALCITDPPYQSLNLEVIRGTTTRLVGGGAKRRPNPNTPGRMGVDENWFETLPDAELLARLQLWLAEMPAHAALYVFADVKTGLVLFPQLPQKNVLVWDKLSIGMGWNWRRMHEWIAYCPKAKHQLRDLGLGDILRCPGVEDKEHPTEKPTSVMVPLLLNSSDPGDLVIDPFCGTGSVLVAAKLMQRRAIGVELSERYCEVAARRLSQSVFDFAPPVAQGELL